MSVGLMDGDMSKYTYVPFNLDIMKLSTYYKRKREIVALSPSFLPDKYSKFIYRKDYVDNDFPQKLLDYDNIEYGGIAFGNGIYTSMPEEIEKCIPDVQLYEKFRNEFCTNKTYTNLFNHMLNACHLRLSLDGKTIWNNFEKSLTLFPKTKIVFLHDQNLVNIEGSKEIITYLLNKDRKGERFLASKFPLIMSTDSELMSWFSWAPAQGFFPIHYHGLMSDETLYELVQTEKGRSVCRQLQYFVTSGCKSEQDFVENRLSHVFRQVAFLRTNRVNFLLKYDEDFFENKKWERVILLINSYMNSLNGVAKDGYERIIKIDSMYRFVTHLKEEKKKYNKSYFDLKEIRELFLLVRDNNLELFDHFYNDKKIIYKGGSFVYE